MTERRTVWHDEIPGGLFHAKGHRKAPEKKSGAISISALGVGEIFADAEQFDLVLQH